MYIYNTLTREKEKFKPLRFPAVKMYQCGPTAYNYAHIGNLKTSVIEDIVARTLRFLWYQVEVVMNITDIDDKTIRVSQESQKTLKEFTHFYTQIFLEDIQKLGCVEPDTVSPISEIIPEMLRLIQTMIHRGFAYISEDGSVYYAIKQFKNYGKLAHLDVSWMKESVRIDNDEYTKDQAADFVLWKAYTPKDWENFWNAEFEIPAENWEKKHMVIKGRPGWHIECSACAMKHLWQQIDIHMGGEDLIFPHHQNEIAQTEACTWKQFSRYWLHSGHVLVDGAKMAKSKNNFYTLRDIELRYPWEKTIYRALRLSFIAGKYRDQIEFNFQKLEQNIKTIQNIDASVKRVLAYSTENTGVRYEFREYMQDIMTRYIEALEDDFSLPEALAVFYEFQKYILAEIREETLTQSEKESAFDMYKTFNEVLALMDFDACLPWVLDIPDSIHALAWKREDAKSQKNYQLADSLRDEIQSLGYTIQDTKNWPVMEKL